MSGHSKWNTIKRAKGAADAKRGAVFTKLTNLITIAAREKGGDLDANFMLRLAVEKAKAANMPKDNIERAIKKGTGELEGGQIEELVYEGIGPSNAQFVVKALTDNKNRSAANIRHIFTKAGGSLGSVMWNFSQKGVFRISNEELKMTDDEWDEFELELIDQGAEDVLKEDEGITIFTKMEDFQKVNKFLEDKSIKTESSGIEFVANDEIDIPENEIERMEKFIETFDDCEDVSDYYTNAKI